jgi:hypothetical protein
MEFTQLNVWLKAIIHTDVGKRAFLLVILAIVAGVAVFFVIGRNIGKPAPVFERTGVDAAKIASLTKLDVSINPKDPGMVMVSVYSKSQLEPGTIAVKTLETIKSLEKAREELKNATRIGISIKSASEKSEFIIDASTLERRFAGELGDKGLWNELLNQNASVGKPTGSGYSKEKFIQLLQALEPEADIKIEDKNVVAFIKARSDWERDVAGFAMSISSCLEVSGYYPDTIKITVDANGTLLNVSFKASALRDLASGKSTPDDFMSRIHIETQN